MTFFVNGINLEDLLLPRAVFSTGGLWGVGHDAYGKLGDGVTGVSKSSPVQTVCGGSNWKSVSCGFGLTGGTKSDGTLWLCGYNSPTRPALGDGTVVAKNSPVQTICGGTNWKQVAAGRFHSAAVKTDGTLWTWGHDAYGQLGDNSVTPKSSPVQTIAGGATWKQVACGNYHTAAVKTDGTLWTWGYNSSYQLGVSTPSSTSSPIQTVAGGNTWKQVAAGYGLTGAVKTDGTLWMWGSGSNGEMGDGTSSSKSSPVQTICGGTNWKYVACGHNFVLAVKTDGTLWTWGNNSNGQLGDGTTTSRSSPVQTIAGGTNWKTCAGGDFHASAVKTDGTLWAWGFNNAGQLGDNTTTPKSSPVQTVMGGTNWKQVACGYQYTMAVSDSSL